MQARIFLKMFCSLAFVPVDMVIYEYQKLKCAIPSCLVNQVDEFLKYFEQFYLSDKVFTNKWNAVSRLRNNIPLTTNSVESFNNNFSKFVDVKHPNLAYLLSNIQLFQSEVEQKIDIAISEPTQQKNNEEKLQKLLKIVDNYKESVGVNSV
jgi:hypothetical protein